MPEADALGIGQSPDEIELIDVNGDGKADYVWTRKLDGRVKVWYNEYPDKPTWREGGEVAEGVGTSGANIRYGKLQSTGRADYIAVDPESGAIAAWLNGCSSPEPTKKKHRVYVLDSKTDDADHMWLFVERPLEGPTPAHWCNLRAKYHRGRAYDENDPKDARYPSEATDLDTLHGKDCYYVGSPYQIGRFVCDGVAGLQCYKYEDQTREDCGPWSYTHALYCDW